MRSLGLAMLWGTLVLGSLSAMGQTETKPQAVVQLQPSGAISAVAQSADGKFYAYGDSGGIVLVYRTSDNLLVRRFNTGGGNGVWCLAFSPDGSKLLVGAWKTSLFDLRTGELLKVARPTYYPQALVFGPGDVPYGWYAPDGGSPVPSLYRVFDVSQDGMPLLVRNDESPLGILRRVTPDLLLLTNADGHLRFINGMGFVVSDRTFASAVVGFDGTPQNYRVALADGTIHRILGQIDEVVVTGLDPLRALEWVPGSDEWVAWADELMAGKSAEDSHPLGISTLDLNMDGGLRRPQLVVLPNRSIMSNAVAENRNPMVTWDGDFVFAEPDNEVDYGWDETVSLEHPRLVIGTAQNLRSFEIRLNDLRVIEDEYQSESLFVRNIRRLPSFNLRASDKTLDAFTLPRTVPGDPIGEAEVSRNGQSALFTIGGDDTNPATHFRHVLVHTKASKRPSEDLDWMRRAIFETSQISLDHPNFFSLSSDGTRVLTRWWVDSGDRSFLFDLENKKLLRSWPGDVSPYGDGGLAIVDQRPDLLVVDMHTGDTVAKAPMNWFQQDGAVDFILGFATSPDGKMLASQTTDGVAFYSLPDFKFLRRARLEAQGGFTRFSRDGRYLVRMDRDLVSFVRVETGAVVHLVVRGNDWVFFTDDGYFEGSTNSGKILAAVQGREAYGMDQVAVRYNRPDIVMQRLGTDATNPELFAFFRATYLKRLARMGLTEAQVAISVPAPVTTVSEPVLSEESARLTAHFQSQTSALARYSVYVNDVPLFGKEGRPLSGLSASVDVEFPLVPGDNKVEVSCFNAAGTESLRVLTKVNGPEANNTNPPDLYLLGFGISTYANPDLNLGYAAKDALDLAQAFQNSEVRPYGAVFTKTLVNEQVNLSTMTAAKEFLAQARPQDTVILFIAGHGIYTQDSASPDYYYIAHDTDVTDIEHTAIRFADIEELLQGLPARQKLFLMDTCNSGEVDPLVAAQSDTALALGKTARAVRGLSVGKIAASQTSAVPRTWLLEKGRYSQNDLIRRSGAIVFSSSKGGEYSYESGAIGNGMFTAALLKALSGDLEGAMTRNGEISVRSLVSAVSAEVPAMTNELQHPGVDRDNISVDFILPRVTAVHP